jgi:hypothetical protein
MLPSTPILVTPCFTVDSIAGIPAADVLGRDFLGGLFSNGVVGTGLSLTLQNNTSGFSNY